MMMIMMIRKMMRVDGWFYLTLSRVWLIIIAAYYMQGRVTKYQSCGSVLILTQSGSGSDRQETTGSEQKNKSVKKKDSDPNKNRLWFRLNKYLKIQLFKNRPLRKFDGCGFKGILCLLSIRWFGSGCSD